jgi:hypothetical protein
MKVISQKKLELNVILDNIIASDLVLSGLGNKDESAKKVLDMTIKAKILLSEIGTLLPKINIHQHVEKDNSMQQDTTKVINNHSQHNEINKVKKKLLKFWSKPERQHNINARILNAFLELKHSGNTHITEEYLQNKLPDIEFYSFYSNFNQMKNKGEKNHGKVFHETMNVIEIWGPVKKFVDEYEKIVFKR